MTDWIAALGDRTGPLADPARVFLRLHGDGDERGAEAVRVLIRALDAQLDDEDASEEDDRRFVEGGGALLGLLLLDRLGGAHAHRDGAHRVRLGARGFFDPFGALENVLEAEEPRAALAEVIRIAEAEARDEGPSSRVVATVERRLAELGPAFAVRERAEMYLRLEGGTELDLRRVVETTRDQPAAAVDQAVDKILSLLRGADAGVDPDEARKRLLPRLVRQSFLEELSSQQPGRGELTTTPLGSDAAVALVLGYDTRSRYVRTDELLRWGLDGDGARRVAIDNLARRSRDAARFARVDTDDGPLVVARSGDGLDSARLLLPGLVDVVGGELGVPFVAAVPHRDALLLAPRAPTSLVDALHARARDDAARAPHPITASLFEIDGNGIRQRY